MNEPIAWMHTNSKQIFKTEKPNQFDLHLFTPLYTHPMRKLTDEEAIQIWDSIPLTPKEGMTGRLKLFKNEILKKASEK